MTFKTSRDFKVMVHGILLCSVMPGSLVLFLVFSLMGCSAPKIYPVDLAIAADSASTYIAIKDGHGFEANPALPAGALPAALGSAFFSKVPLMISKRKNKRLCKAIERAIISSKVGATVNNALVIKGSDNSFKAGIAATGAAFVFSKKLTSYCEG